MNRKICFALFLMSIFLMCCLTSCGHEHVWNEWEIIQEATCTKEGIKEHSCECGEIETASISKISHKWGDWQQDQPCDLFEYIRCTVCGVENEYRIAPKRHNYDSNGFCVDCKEKVYYTVEEIKRIIRIDLCDLGEYNGEALTDLKIVWKNLSEKEIDETIFSVTACYSDETDSMRVTNKDNVKPGETAGSSSYWETLWPTGMWGEEITSIQIIYTDGTKIVINGESLKYTKKGYGDIKLDGVIYSLSDDCKSYFVSGCYENEITIHSTVNGKPVDKIGDRCFYQNNSLKSVIIEEGITEIGDNAFCLCKNLSDIQLPSTITKIGEGAFTLTLWEQNQSDGILYIGKVLYKYIGIMPQNTSIIVPEGIISVSSGAFGDVIDDNCKGLTYNLYLQQ